MCWVGFGHAMIDSSTLKRATIVVLVVGGTCGAWVSVRSPPRPSIGPWAGSVQAAFEGLPNATPKDTLALSPREACAQTVEILERARTEFVPAPTPAIERAFLDYTDALLALYRECPENESRATVLHDRANVIGVQFEALVNHAIGELNAAIRLTDNSRSDQSVAVHSAGSALV